MSALPELGDDTTHGKFLLATPELLPSSKWAFPSSKWAWRLNGQRMDMSPWGQFWAPFVLNKAVAPCVLMGGGCYGGILPSRLL